MSNNNTIRKQGALKVLKKTIRLQNWCTRWAILRTNGKTCGLSLELYNSVESASVGKIDKIYEFSYNVGISMAEYNGLDKIIIIKYKKNESRQFMAINELDAIKWKEAFVNIPLRDRKNSMSTRGSLSSFSSNSSFCKCLQNSFQVRMQTQSKVFYQEEVILQVVNNQIKITATSPPFREFMSWPITCIRQYTLNENVFRFECGRKSKTGEGFFYFESPQANDIFYIVNWTSTNILNKQDDRPPTVDAPRPPMPSHSPASPQIPPYPSHYEETERIQAPPIPDTPPSANMFSTRAMSTPNGSISSQESVQNSNRNNSLPSSQRDARSSELRKIRLSMERPLPTLPFLEGCLQAH